MNFFVAALVAKHLGALVVAAFAFVLVFIHYSINIFFLNFLQNYKREARTYHYPD